MISRILTDLYFGDTTDSIKFGFPMVPIQGMIDLSGWNAEREINQGDFSTVENAVKLIERFVKNGYPVLVFCHAGMDRSPFIVACYIYKHYERPGYDEYDSYDFVKEKHPQTIIHDDWMDKFVFEKEE